MINSIETLTQILKNPDSSCRSAPFWGWNDRLRPEELVRQLKDMKGKGMGGAFIHSREGLETPYLSEEWMDDVDVSIGCADREDMEIWIYDEDKWPSGSAGGCVSAADPERFTAKGLTLEVLPGDALLAEEPAGIRVVGKYFAHREGRKLLSLEPADGEAPEGACLVVLRRELSASSEWYNGFAPTDCLNPEAVKKFLEMTHHRYRQRFGAHFGKTLKGFFTDEPNCCDFYSIFTPGRPWLPWTDAFAEYFISRRGYDPIPMLPYLFFEGPRCAQIRHDYWRTITELFSESFMKPMYAFCQENGVELTGHILYENDLGYNIRVCGAAMPQYRYLHRPGIDLLGEQCREYLTVRQCSSAAHQYGREHTITETYGCTGWEFDFAGQKWLGDWQFVNGITRRCQHMTLYSIRGCRKRDYPPVFNYQNTWWEYNNRMEDYFARLSAAVRTGRVSRKILLLHPISGLWTRCGSDPDEDLGRVEMNMGWTDEHIMSLNRKGEETNRLAETLVRNHLDFDFGDEIILSEIARIQEQRMIVGSGEYETVIVPPVESLFRSTLELLERFAHAGGHIIWMGEAPRMVEGRPSQDAENLAGRQGIRRVTGTAELLRELERGRMVSCRTDYGTEDTQILTMLRECEDGWLLFAVNHDREKSRFVTFALPQPGAVSAYDPWTEESRELSVMKAGSGVEFSELLAPAQSRIYFLRRDLQPSFGVQAAPYRHPHYTESVFAALGPSAPFRRTDPNVLVLDRCSYQLGQEEFSEDTDVWMAQREIRSRLQMQQIYYNGAPQRYFWATGASVEGTPFALRFVFRADQVPQGICRLAVENPEALTLRCNGIPCPLTEEWFSDRATRCFRLPSLQEGDNELILSGLYTLDRELEDVFLIGDFGVSRTRSLIREPEQLQFGDWCLQGYPHYHGSMIYTFRLPGFVPNGKSVVLNMGPYRASLVEVLVNGVSAGELFGKCRSSMDLTALLREEENILELKVVGSPRNMYGPFHNPDNSCSRISWADFRCEGSARCDGYVLKPYGIMGQIILSLQ